MKILIASSEVAPLAKTGGLADVAGSLPRALAQLRHNVAVVMPFHGSIDRSLLPDLTIAIEELAVELGAGSRIVRIWRASLPGTQHLRCPVTVYLVEDPGLFDRAQLYVENGQEYPDNALRFGYFCMAALRMLAPLGWIPDAIQCNDWQTALIPIYQARHSTLRSDPVLATIPALYTIHNLAYQGVYPAHMASALGLPPECMSLDDMEYYGQLNLMKGGITHAAALSTVSRAYAREIQTPEFGCGLHGHLVAHAGKLTGILNGIDIDEWNPATDPRLAANYSADEPGGKLQCKRALQRHFGLPVRDRTPLLGVVTRLTDQKGLDLMVEALPALLPGRMQFVLLGTGDPRYHAFFEQLARDFPDKVGIQLGFDDTLAHRIEAGCDIFLMPSAFEPCGLNQMYSMRYGTPPVVRRTGGLADSVRNASPTGIAEGKATGFVFTEYSAAALTQTVKRAMRLYRGQPESWRAIVSAGMRKDFSWKRSAYAYLKVLRRIAKPSMEPVS